MATEYGKRLKQAIEFAQLTQKQFISKTGLPQSTISSAMNRGSGSSHTARFAAVCKVSAEWLATGDGSMEIQPSSTSERSESQQPMTRPKYVAPNSGAALARWFEKLPHDNNIRNSVFVECWEIIERNLPDTALAPTHKHSERDDCEIPALKHPA